MESDSIQTILEKNGGDHSELISVLEGIQARYGYLPELALKTVANKTGLPLVDVYGVATFYRSFSLTPRGKHLISVCLGTACHVRGAPSIAEEFERQLRICAGETTPDKEFTLETVNCLGACALGPIVVVDGHYFSNVTTVKVSRIIKDARLGLDMTDVRKDKRIFPVELSCPHCNHSLMDPDYLINGYPSIRLTISFGRKHGWVRPDNYYD